MKSNTEINQSRRKFLNDSALLLAGTFLAKNTWAAPAYIPDLLKPKSLINGVQMGVITYSYRDMPDQSLEAVLQYILDSGLNAVELMGDPVEYFAGKPKNPVDMRSIFPLMRKRSQKLDLTEDEKLKLEEADKLNKEYSLAVAKWRLNAPMDKITKAGKLFKKAGVKIYGFKPNAFGKNNTDAEIEYGMRAARAIGANQVTLEHPSDDAHTLKLGKFGEKHGIKIGYHGHEQQTYTLWDTAIAQSPANGLNLDFGHFVAAGNPNPVEFVKMKHDKITSMHLKDRQTPANGKGNLLWGTGDTPIAEILQTIRNNKFNFPVTIELEYKIPEGSNAVEEVKKCLEFARKALS